MNKLNPKNKICFQNNGNIHINLKLNKLKKKNGIFLKKKFDIKKNLNLKQEKNFFKNDCLKNNYLKIFMEIFPKKNLKI